MIEKNPGPQVSSAAVRQSVCHSRVFALCPMQDDEMCVKVALAPIAASEGRAAKQLSESISFKSKGIDGDYTGSA